MELASWVHKHCIFWVTDHKIMVAHLAVFMKTLYTSMHNKMFLKILFKYPIKYAKILGFFLKIHVIEADKYTHVYMKSQAFINLQSLKYKLHIFLHFNQKGKPLH